MGSAGTEEDSKERVLLVLEHSGNLERGKEQISFSKPELFEDTPFQRHIYKMFPTFSISWIAMMSRIA